MKTKHAWIKKIEEVSKASDDSLRRSLLTIDGRGISVKEACLDELLKRQATNSSCLAAQMGKAKESCNKAMERITGWSADMLMPGTWSSIAVDADGRPRISFYDLTAGDLVLAVLFDTGWLPIRLDQFGDVGLYTSQHLRDGTSHISYYYRSLGDLK